MINFILILLGSLAGCYLIAIAIQTALKWFAENPMFWVGCLIGVIISAIGFRKLRRHDKDYYEQTKYLPPVSKNHTPKTAQVAVSKPEPAAQDYKDIHTCLTRQMGYTSEESQEAIEYIQKTAPDKSLSDKILTAINYLSGERVGK